VRAAVIPDAQPLWAIVPVASRAGYIRRAAVAMLDELDDLARLLAEETGWPREDVVRSELLPAVRGLHDLADGGPRALAERRLSRRAAALLGRERRLVHAPAGVVALRGPSASPWCEPALETAAGLLAGNAVVLAGVAGPRLRNVFLRAGVPGELVELGAPPDGARVIELPRPGRNAALLVLEGAPREQVVEAARWAARGGHAAQASRLVAVAGALPGLALDGALELVELPDTDSAVRAVADADPVSIWAGDADKARRVALRLPATTTWIGHHGPPRTRVEERLARHLVHRQIALRGPLTAAGDVELQTALAEVRHGRESRRWPALRALVRESWRRR